ncbi:unnamed protein product [Cladocopium goreaui]|uniref:Uncharacterized protein n=1 Tax=Cladocopium goreaui TaxID=2562237 RepID=A0A9P1BR18_9DINO|nr:unnamed protein product [Cladocopium goreaui]
MRGSSEPECDVLKGARSLDEETLNPGRVLRLDEDRAILEALKKDNKMGKVQRSPLSRQQGESVVSFISRHRRWWRLVKELDKQAKHLQSRLKAWRRDAYFTPLCSCHDEQMGELNRRAWLLHEGVPALVAENKVTSADKAEAVVDRIVKRKTSWSLWSLSCTHMDDPRFAYMDKGKDAADAILNRFSKGSLRYCGHRFSQDDDITIHADVRDNIRNPAASHGRDRKMNEPLPQDELTSLRSVVGGDKLRALLCGLTGNFESVKDPGCKVQDKSLGIELSALKQALWINGLREAWLWMNLVLRTFWLKPLRRVKRCLSCYVGVSCLSKVTILTNDAERGPEIPLVEEAKLQLEQYTQKLEQCSSRIERMAAVDAVRLASARLQAAMLLAKAK